MAKLLDGDRIGRQAQLRVGCSATIFDADQRVLLTRRTDNGLWCLPGGGMDPGEDMAEACAREVWEETGLRVRVTRLLGVYSSPHRIIEYADGARYQIVALNFEVEVVGGTLGLSDETTEVGYFSQDEIETLDLMEHHRERIADAFADSGGPFIR